MSQENQTTSNLNWREKTEWAVRGPQFTIVVSKHQQLARHETGPNVWCVYAYIYPEHPYFKEFKGTDLWQEATSIMPLHGGCSYLDYPGYQGEITSVKVGADYNHYRDEYFTHYATAEDAAEVFKDAQILFNWLESRCVL